jgi:hypothetical protein
LEVQRGERKTTTNDGAVQYNSITDKKRINDVQRRTNQGREGLYRALGCAIPTD